MVEPKFIQNVLLENLKTKLEEILVELLPKYLGQNKDKEKLNIQQEKRKRKGTSKLSQQNTKTNY